jgi:hypothetical protein
MLTSSVLRSLSARYRLAPLRQWATGIRSRTNAECAVLEWPQEIGQSDRAEVRDDGQDEDDVPYDCKVDRGSRRCPAAYPHARHIAARRAHHRAHSACGSYRAVTGDSQQRVHGAGRRTAVDLAMRKEFRVAHLPPGAVAGIIDGSISAGLEPDGSVSFRVIVGPGGSTTECDLVEVTMGAGYVARFARALGSTGSAAGQNGDSVPLFPCRVGIGRSVTSADQ